ncbi:SLC13 family permease [Paenibacillus sp. MBLB4367]|uniref:SLC13 family permease n=1 Tax=Paenibacillus sp. MBLB4367 TaxID=3384767 RepID=UPI003907ED9A
MQVTQIDMFRGLTAIEQARLLGKLEQVRAASGEVIFKQHAEGDSMYIIRSGRIELFTLGADGQSHSLAVLQEGDTFGEMALLTGEARTATAVALGETMLSRIDAETFLELTNESPVISNYFIRLLAKRLVSTNRELHSSKEERQKLIRDELEALPEPVRTSLLYAAAVPIASIRFLAGYLGYPSLPEAWEDNPKLETFVQPVPGGGSDLVAVDPAFRAMLAETFVKAFGYEKRKTYIRALALYLSSTNSPHLAVELAGDSEDWSLLFELAEGQETELAGPATDWQTSLYTCLDGCPGSILYPRYPLFLRYLTYSLEAAGDAAFSKLESALASRRQYFSDGQAAELYQIGADYCRRRNEPDKALEYLGMAGLLSVTVQQPTGAVPAAGSLADDGRSYWQAKLSLDGIKRTMRVDEAAQRFGGKSGRKALIAVLLAASCMLFFHLSDPFGGLSREGMNFVGVALAAVVLWIVNIVPDFLVALFMAMYWVLGGIAEPSAALSGFAEPVWFYMLFILALGTAITKSGILYRLSLIALKAFPKSYQGQLWGITISGLLLNPLIPSSTAKATLGVPIAKTISESMGFAHRSKGAAGLGLAAMVFYGFMAPFFLTGSYTNVMAYGLVPGQSELSWFAWMFYALPPLLVFVLGMKLCIRLFFRPDSPGRPLSDQVLQEQFRILGKLTKDEKTTLAVAIGCIGLMMLQPLHGIDNVWIMLFGFAALVVGGVLDNKTLKSGIDWPFMLFIGIAFSFTQVATQLGVVEALSGTLAEYMAPFMGSPYTFLLAVIVISFLVTLVIRDDPAVIVLVMSLLPLAAQIGIHPWVLVFVVLLSTDPFFFPYQSPTYLTAYYSSEEKAFTHKQGMRMALCYAGVVAALVAVCIPYWKLIDLIP